MVGLYHKRRAQRAQNKAVSFVIRAFSVLALISAILVLIVAIFFTGTRVKGPLASYLSARSGLEVQIESAEFSPLYPNIIKLQQVSFGNSLIGEFYLEYELSSLWSDTLHIKDIYINKLKLDPQDLKKIASSQFGYQKISADAVRFHHTPLQTQYLQSLDATIRLHQVEFSHESGLNFVSGVVSTQEAEFFHNKIKGLTVEFERLQDGLKLNNFNLAMLGGMVSGEGLYLQNRAHRSLEYNTTSASDQSTEASPSIDTDLRLSELNLSKIIIQDAIPTAANVNLQADIVNLSDVIFTSSSIEHSASTASTASSTTTASATTTSASADKANSATSAGAAAAPAPEQVSNDFIMQGISGQLHDLKLNANTFSGSFKGSIDAFSLPQIQTTFEHNTGTANLSSEQVDFDFKGQLFTGNYQLQGSLNYPKKELMLDHVHLEKNKLAINPPRMDYLEHNLGQYSIKLKSADFEGMEFLSFINSLPLSMQSISGSMENLQLQPVIDEEHRALKEHDGKNFALYYNLGSHLLPLDSTKTGLISYKIQNTLYSNLLMQEIEGELKVTDKSLTLDLPRVFFKESELKAQATLERDLNKPSLLFLQAKNFESADLNSNLIGHMLTGKFDLDVVLTSSYSTPAAAGAAAAGAAGAAASQRRVLDGSIVMQAPNLLVSDFGLDLINGGHLRDFNLSGTELMTAIQGSVAGINSLQFNSTIYHDLINSSGTLGLSTANMSFTGEVDLGSKEITGVANLISLARDSSTEVTLSGLLDEMHFAIHAQSRGVERPGLYLPQYEASAVAKEQTDAAAVLKGLVQIEPEVDPKQTNAGPADEPSLIDQALQQNKTTSAIDPAQNSSTSAAPAETSPDPKAEAVPPEVGTAEQDTTSESDATVTPAAEDATATATAPESETETTASTESAETTDTTPESTATVESNTAATTAKEDVTATAPESETETETAASTESTEDKDATAESTATVESDTTATPAEEDATAAAPESETAASTESAETTDTNAKSTATTESDTTSTTTKEDVTATAPESKTETAASTESTETTDTTAEISAAAESNTTATPAEEEDATATAAEATGTESTAPYASTAGTAAPASATVPATAPAPAEEKESPITSTVSVPQPQEKSETMHDHNAEDQQSAEDEAQKMEDEANKFELNLLKDAFIDSLRNRENFDFTGNDDEMIF